ncbi:hypothetical protein [Streptomyces sp. NBC_01518]|uniref:hypothetical protein n=1 Tax=Streptomyces sp. NBC_01518 TaxID=2903891 RepID=UPI0038693F73
MGPPAPADDVTPQPPAAPAAAVSAPCERCGQPLAPLYDPEAPEPDGRHCADCRLDLTRQPATTLLKALFGPRPK